MRALFFKTKHESAPWAKNSCPSILVMAAVLLFFSGCIGGKRTNVIEQYTLEYPSPVFAGLSKIDATIKVNLFSVNPAFNSPAMVYRPGPFQQDTYNYSRWIVNPGDMVSDYLLRDLRNSGLFTAVFSYSDTEDAGFVLQGSVEKFLEVDGKDGSRVELTLNVILLNAAQRELTKRIVFQKNYVLSGPLEAKTAAGFAAGMSKTVELFSIQLIKDIYQSVKGSLPAGGSGDP